MVSDRDMEKAVRLYQDKKMGGTIQMKNKFLMEKGFTYMDCLEAMNTATNGQLVKSAVGED